MDTRKYIKDKYSVPDNTGAMKLKGVLRNDLYVLFKELGFTLGCEVGVYRGINAEVILETIPNLKLHLVDSWVRRNSLRETHKRLKRFIPQTKIVEMTSMDAVRYYTDEFFDFVYIDASHYFDFVMQDIIEWSKKVRPGGIVAGHDFYRSRKEGVVEAVKAYTTAHYIKPWFILSAERRRSPRKNSWFFVKC
jgi:predicted O-methyltransferase YrrM